MSGSVEPPRAIGRYAHVDALRALAVSIVVVSHAGLGAIVPGGTGVTLFFSISGFIITVLLLRERDTTGGFSAGSFYFRRAMKIGPPFLVVIAIPTLVLSLWHAIDWPAFLAQIFFVYNWVAIDSQPAVLPGSGVVWSLAIEEQFYIVFAIIWLLMVRSRSYLRGITLLAVAAIVLSVGARFALFFSGASEDRIYQGTDTRMEGLAWGILAAVVFAWWSRAPTPPRSRLLFGSPWVLVSAAAVLLVSLLIRDEAFRSTGRYTLQSVATCAVILYGFSVNSSRLKQVTLRMFAYAPVQLIGHASYSIYLIHLPLYELLTPLFSGLPVAVRTPLEILLGVGAGILIYLLVEKPALALRNRITAARTPTAEQIAV
ncbi:MAG: acyltransferase [Naasia sp.]|uniref:acyltransferase family protein n=1 Tax=Naasia sp. TaxID=2546198 RepID=UPI00261AEE3B|nr:acyltransferase [Naasia sp.]MCU1569984.1 acyltransferase [Naasia sp.]